MKYELYFKGKPTGIKTDVKEYAYTDFCKEYKKVMQWEFAIYVEFKES